MLDLAPVLEAIEAALRPNVDQLADRHGFAVERVNNAEARTFVTGRVGETLVVFDFTHDLVGSGNELARVISSGEALVTGSSAPSLRLESMELEVYGEAGFASTGRLVFLRGSLSLGTAERHHELRVPAPGSQSSPW